MGLRAFDRRSAAALIRAVVCWYTAALAFPLKPCAVCEIWKKTEKLLGIIGVKAAEA